MGVWEDGQETRLRKKANDVMKICLERVRATRTGVVSSPPKPTGCALSLLGHQQLRILESSLSISQQEHPVGKTKADLNLETIIPPNSTR